MHADKHAAKSEEIHENVSVEQKRKPQSKALAVQCKFSANRVVQREASTGAAATPQDANQTGIPNRLKSGMENLSGYDLSAVRVHYNSPKPRQLGALAYAQGTNIHLGAGQEKHLPHEAWHVVQQMQGRVKPTRQMKNKTSLNDDCGLEHEADVMGAKALQKGPMESAQKSLQNKLINTSVAQGVLVGQTEDNGGGIEDEWGDGLSFISKVDETIYFTNRYLGKAGDKQALRADYGVKRLRTVYRHFMRLQWLLNELKYLVDNRLNIRPYAYGQQPKSKGELKSIIQKTATKIKTYSLQDSKLNTRQSIITELDEIRERIERIDRVRGKKKRAKQEHKDTVKETLSVLGDQKKATPENDLIDRDISKVKSVKYSTKYIDLSTTSVANLSAIINPILGGDVGSLAITFSVGVSQGLGGILKVGGGATFEQTLWVEDDKRIRMKKGIHLSGYAEAGFQGVLGAEGSLGVVGLTRTQVFNSPEQWAAYTGQKCLLSVLNGIRAFKRAAKKYAAAADNELTQNEIDDFSFLSVWGIDYPFITEIIRYSQENVTKVTAQTFNLSSEFNAFSLVGLNASVTETILNFRKKRRNSNREVLRKDERWGNVFSFNLGFSLGSYFDLQFTYTKIHKHANPDNDGSYISIKIISKAAKLEYGFSNPDVADAVHATLEKFQPFAGNENVLASDENGSEVLKPVIEQVKKAFSAEQFLSKIGDVSLLADLKIGKQTTPSIEGVYMYSKGGYRRLYTRKALDVSLSAEATIYTGGAVNVDLGMSASKAKGEDISVGTDTLAYFLTVYNGYKKRKKSRDTATEGDSKNEWKEFVKKWSSSFDTLFGKLRDLENNKKLKLELEDKFSASPIILHLYLNRFSQDQGFAASINVLEEMFNTMSQTSNKF